MNEIFSLITNTAIPTLYINGYIGKDEESVNVDAVKKILSQVQGRRLNMEVNSGGGSMIEGFAIHDALVNSGLEIETTITGIAGSMASVLILAGKTITMYKHARIMTHRPKMVSIGEPERLESEAKLGRDMERQVKDLFIQRTGKSQKEVDSWFQSGVDKWFNSDEALRANIVDSVIEGVVHIPDNLMPKATSDVELVQIYNQLNSNKMSKTPIILNQVTANKIGVPQNTDEETLVNRAETLVSENETLKSENTQLKADLKLKTEAEATKKVADATVLVENAIKAGKINATSKESFIKQATDNYTDVKNMLDGIAERKPLHTQVHSMGQNPAKGGADMTDRSNWTYIEWAKNDPTGLAKMQTENPEAFAELRK